MEDKKKILIGLLAVVLIILCCFIGYTMFNTPKETLQINDMNINVDEWGIYNLVGHITPLKDFDYLEARVIFYNANGTVIGNGYAWNMLHPQKGTPISINNPAGVCKETPDHAVVSFYDRAGSDKPIANFTVKFTGDGNNQTTNNDVVKNNKANTNNSKLVHTPNGDFHVGDIISDNGHKYRVNADGSLTLVEKPTTSTDSSSDFNSYDSQEGYYGPNQQGEKPMPENFEMI